MSNRIPEANIRLKRAYDPPAADDGVRILVDRLWPRGVRKPDAALDRWMKEVAPSAELRRWFGHDPARWEEFRRRYRAELHTHGADIAELRNLARHGRVTLIFSAHDATHNDAAVLREFLLSGPQS